MRYGMKFAALLMLVLCVGCQPQAMATPTGSPINTPSPLPPSPTPEVLLGWVSPAIPSQLLDRVKASGLQLTEDANSASAILDTSGETSGTAIPWVFTVVCPFPTVMDGVSMEEIQLFWSGSSNALPIPLLMDLKTLAAWSEVWGEPMSGVVEVYPGDQILGHAWQSLSQCALIPFEDLSPRWKVLAVDGQSPLSTDFSVEHYPLVRWFDWQGAQADAARNVAPLTSNYDPQKLTTVLVTGTTALVRGIASRMETKSITYPAEQIGAWLRSADITHISNEAPFTANCTIEDPWQMGTTFCSKPEYMALLSDVGADVIELSGNHLADYGIPPMTETLTRLKDAGFQVFASGATVEEARQPLLLTDHSNHIAFLGCNEAGPERVWVTDQTPGVAQCDWDWMAQTIGDLKEDGYQVIVTIQYRETWDPKPMPWQREDFASMAQAGAVIVSGSQAHLPMAMTFVRDSFVPYGLGNLFFDQMDTPIPGTRREMLTRHVFYNNRYISTELLTAMLEDYAQPRPMTQEERAAFLADIFDASIWQEDIP